MADTHPSEKSNRDVNAKKFRHQRKKVQTGQKTADSRAPAQVELAVATIDPVSIQDTSLDPQEREQLRDRLKKKFH